MAHHTNLVFVVVILAVIVVVAVEGILYQSISQSIESINQFQQAKSPRRTRRLWWMSTTAFVANLPKDLSSARWRDGRIRGLAVCGKWSVLKLLVISLVPVSELLYQVQNQSSVSGVLTSWCISNSGLGRRASEASASLVESMQFPIHETDGAFERW